MRQLPCISIITPSFNQGQFIEQTILSVLNQNYPNLEYIIIDGGSTDNTVEIIKKYEKHLKYWVSEPDNGHSHAVNKGLLYCTGDIFNWLNSDDYYEKGALHAIAHEFINKPNLHIVGGKERAFDSDTNNTIEFYNGTNINDDLAELIWSGIIDQPPTFWKLDIVKQMGKLPINLHYTMDSYWWTKYLLTYGVKKVGKIQKLVTHFRLHNQSKTVLRQHLFNSNRFAIRHTLANKLGFDKTIIHYLQAQTDIVLEDVFHDVQLTDDVSREKLEACFAWHIYPRYYIEKDYISANRAFDLVFSYYKNKQTLIDFIKFKILPQILLKKLRK